MKRTPFADAHSARSEEEGICAHSARLGEVELKQAIGMMAGQNRIVAYSINPLHSVTVTATRCGDNHAWQIVGTVDGSNKAICTVIGRRNLANRLASRIRNGLVSDVMKRWRLRANKKQRIEGHTPPALRSTSPVSGEEPNAPHGAKPTNH